MTNVVPLKKGDVLVPQSDSTWSVNWVEGEIIDVTTVNGVKQAWINLKPVNGSSTLHTLTVEGLRKSWKRKPTFYSIGKTYTWRRATLHTETFKIMDVFSVENPLSSDYRFSAFAIVTDYTGKRYGTSLNVSDFNRMKLA